MALIRLEKLGLNTDKLEFKFVCKNLMDIQICSKTDPFLKFYRPTAVKTSEMDGEFFDPKDIPANNWLLIYQTEHCMSNLNPEFNSWRISGEKMSKGDYTLPIKVEFYDWESGGSHRIVGHLYFRMHDIIQTNARKWEFFSCKKKKSAGFLHLEKFTIINKPTLLPIIENGLKINTIVGIDFTSSNIDSN